MPKTMRAVRVYEFGGPERLKIETVPIPKPGPCEVLIHIRYAGVNMVDSYYRRGWYRPASLPFVPGIEVAGVVARTGERVRNVAVGQRVIAVMVPGGYADYMVASSAFVAPIPDKVETVLAVSTALQGMTAFFLSHDTFRVGTGHSILIHSAASAVGAYLASLASYAGARVIGAVSSPAKSAYARSHGCHDVIQYADSDFVSLVQRATNGEGVDVVYDFSGAETFLESLKCLRPRGLMVLCGQSSGPAAAFDPQILRTCGSLYLTRPTLTDYLKPAGQLTEIAARVWALAKDGVLEPLPIVAFPLEQAGFAHEQLADRNRIGKLLLEVGHS